jgi:FkbM family methyltransferase
METAPSLLVRRRHNAIPIRGVIHVGALLCEEWEDYRNMGVGKVLWIEGNPESVSVARQILKLHGVDGNQHVIQGYMSHHNGKEDFYHTKANSRNDSLMKPCTWYEEISVKSKETVDVKRLDTLIFECGENIGDYNALVVDVQGAELKVLAGAGDMLNNMDFIVTEAWHDDLEVFGRVHYDNSATVTRLKSFLDVYDFEETLRTPTEQEDPGHAQAWLDILYERIVQ